MTSIIFHWITPKGFESPHAIKRILARWTLTCKAFGVKNIICVSKDKMQIRDTEINFTQVGSFKEAYKLVDGELIHIEQGGTQLEEYKHPKNCTYVFGSDYSGLNVDKCISINSDLPIHAEVAAGIVLSHRYSQCHS